jgi:hypothetical protein
MVGYDCIEELYSLSEAIAACWRMADLTKRAWCILNYRKRRQTDGTPIYGIASGTSLNTQDDWRDDWEVTSIRDPSIWLHHQPAFRFTVPLVDQG